MWGRTRQRPRAPDLEGLREFNESRDRQLTPFFVGRHEVIREIEAQCAAVNKAWLRECTTPAAGATQVIQGAPGAGKTALLEFLTLRWRGPGQPIAVSANDDRLSTRSVLAAILRTLNPRKARALAKGGGRRVEVRSTVPGVSVAGARQASISPLSQWQELKDALGRRDWRRPVCLLIDEAQGIDESARPLLRTLHMANHGLPVIPVLAGLAHTTERLRELGISRLAINGVHTLPPLSPDEAAESFAKFLAHFRVAGSAEVRQEWTQAIVEDSQGWPQHLHVGLMAAAQTLAARQGALSPNALESARAQAAAMRRRYYSARTTPAMGNSLPLVAAAMAGLAPNGQPVWTFTERLAQAVRDQEGWRLPKGMEPRDFTHHLIQAGVLHAEGGNVFCPIPSLRAHLIAQGEEGALGTGRDSAEAPAP